MKSCLYCGVVDICENFSNAPKTCKNYMRRATISDLIKLGIFTRTNAPHESVFNKYQIEQINFIIDENKLREKKYGRPYSCISPNPEYNSEYLERIIKTKWVKILEEKLEENLKHKR